jgi:hypothetical protein
MCVNIRPIKEKDSYANPYKREQSYAYVLTYVPLHHIGVRSLPPLRSRRKNSRPLITCDQCMVKFTKAFALCFPAIK